MKTRHGLEIRGITSADAPGLVELLGSAGHAISSRALTERLEAIRQQPGAALTAVAWGPPSGLIVSAWHRTLYSDRPAAQVTSLLVGPDERRRGIGRLLIKAAAQAARSAGCDTLEVLVPRNEDNLRAFCLAAGFVEAGGRFSRALRKKG